MPTDDDGEALEQLPILFGLFIERRVKRYVLETLEWDKSQRPKLNVPDKCRA